MKEKEYYIALELKFDYSTFSTSKKQAIKDIKDLFYQEYGITLRDSEIILVEEQ
jgi:hypothetical protein